MQPHYREALAIGWRILWQGVGSFMAALFIANLLLLLWLPELTRAGPSFWAWALPLLIVSIVAFFVFMPLVVRALLTKQFRGFRLLLVRESSESAGTNDGSQKEVWS
jgi:apolipoprotein N-acyltransferase